MCFNTAYGQVNFNVIKTMTLHHANSGINTPAIV